MNREEALKFYERFKIYIFPFVAALSCLILIFFVIYPQGVKLLSNKGVQDDLAKRSEFLEAKAATLESVDEAGLTTKLQYALASYPPEKDFANILGIIKGVANENGFSINGMIINPSAGGGGTDSQKYSVKTDLLGSKNLLSRLISSIESQPRIMKVATIEITKNPLSDSISVLMDIEVLYEPAPVSFGGSDSPIPEISQEDEELLATLASFRGPSQPTVSVPQAGPKGKSNPFE